MLSGRSPRFFHAIVRRGCLWSAREFVAKTTRYHNRKFTADLMALIERLGRYGRGSGSCTSVRTSQTSSLPRTSSSYLRGKSRSDGMEYP